jgi:6-phosphofructokinase
MFPNKNKWIKYLPFCQDCCLIPESPFYLEGEGGLFRYIEKRLKDNGHMVIVVAEGAGQKLIAETMQSIGKDASGNELLLDVGLWLSQKINVRLLHLLLFTSSGSVLHQMVLLYACLCFTLICNI